LEAGALPRDREVLARETTADDIDFAMFRKLLRVDRPDIFVDLSLWKSRAKHGTRARIDLYTPCDVKSSPPETKVDSADP
jgi:hypothetical protein